MAIKTGDLNMQHACFCNLIKDTVRYLRRCTVNAILKFLYRNEIDSFVQNKSHFVVVVVRLNNPISDCPTHFLTIIFSTDTTNG